MFQYALFDLDGTLTDPKEGICKSVQFALHMQGIEEPDIDKLTPFIGPPLKGSFMEYYHMTEDQAMLAIQDYRKRFQPIGLFENKVYPGIPDMLANLKKAGVVLGVASSKPEPFVIKILEHFDMAQYFDIVVGATMDEKRTEKEEVVEEALRRLALFGRDEDASENFDIRERVNRATCAMVGDRKYDITGGHAHDLTAVGVSYGYAIGDELVEAGADYIAKNVRQLENYLLTAGGDEKKNTLPGKVTEVSQMMQSADYAAWSTFHKTGHILLPLIIYYVGYNLFYMLLVMIMDKLLLGNASIAAYLKENSTATLQVIQSASMLAGALCLIPRLKGEHIPMRPQKMPNIIVTALFAVSLSLGLNILFDLLKASEEAYTEVATRQYGVPLSLGLILYGIVSPFAEELLFRGLIYGRMRKFFNARVAMVVSSLLFGAYHGNWMQGIYGFLLGLMIVYVYEKTQHFAMPLIAHAVANIAIFMLTYDGTVIAKSAEPMLLTICSIFIIASYLFMRYRGKNYVR